MQPPDPIVLTVVTRPDCELCEEMARAARRAAARWHAAVRVLGPDQAPGGPYPAGELPLLLIDGRRAFRYRVDERELARRLRRAVLRRYAARAARALRGA